MRAGYLVNFAIAASETNRQLERAQAAWEAALAVDVASLGDDEGQSAPRGAGLTDEGLSRAESILRCMATAGTFTTGH